MIVGMAQRTCFLRAAPLETDLPEHSPLQVHVLAQREEFALMLVKGVRGHHQTGYSYTEKGRGPGSQQHWDCCRKGQTYSLRTTLCEP